MYRSLSKLALLVPLLAVLAYAGPVRAQQGSVEVTPFGGLYLPTADLATEFNGVAITPEKQKTAFVFGARVAGWVTQAVGIEGSFGYALSDVKTDVSTGSVSSNANVWLADLALLYAFPMQSDVASVFVKVGPTLVGHVGSDTWDGFSGRTDIGGMGGVGVRFQVAPTVGIRVDAEDHIFSAKFKEDATGFESGAKLQNDLMLTAGVSIRAGGSR
ncbi:MAG TPA: outer membrane beta-barrel protein [Gemmatimonadota bacterium]|nr:outer membrane beta-barrel protein [Gemmatimonadota bacterium]